MLRECIKIIGVIALAAFIPLLLVVNTFQAKSCIKLQNEVFALDKKQYDLIESNNRLITNISILSSPERIEIIAKDVLHMRKAVSGEIIRVEVKGKNVGG